jgi:hypothetical protein
MTHTPSLPNLRPLSLGELLDQAIRLYRRNFFKFIGIIAAVQVPVTLINIIVTILTFDDFYAIATDPSRIEAASDPFAVFTPGYFLGFGGTMLVSFLSFLLLQGIAAGALTRLVSDTYLGQTTGIEEAFSRIGKRWLPLIGTLLVYVLLFVVLFVWLIVPCLGWFTGPGMMVVFGGMVLPLIAPVVVLETSSGWGAIRRAWELVRKRFWWIFGFMIILNLFSGLVVSGPATLFSTAVSYLLPSTGVSGDNALLLQTIIQSLIGLVFSILYYPLQLACATLLYFDLRIRQEGLDLMLQAEGQGQRTLNLSELIAQTPPAPGGSLFTWGEMGYMVLIAVGFLVIYFGLIAVFFGIGLAAMGGF